MAVERKVEFKFDDRSLVSVDEMKRDGIEFTDIVMIHPETGERQIISIPILKDEPLKTCVPRTPKTSMF